MVLFAWPVGTCAVCLRPESSVDTVRVKGAVTEFRFEN